MGLQENCLLVRAAEFGAESALREGREYLLRLVDPKLRGLVQPSRREFDDAFDEFEHRLRSQLMSTNQPKNQPTIGARRNAGRETF